MGEELLWKALTGSVVDGQTSDNAVSEWKNESGETFSVRKVIHAVSYDNAEHDEGGQYHFAKSPTSESYVDNSTIYDVVIDVTQAPAANPSLDGKISKLVIDAYAKGQLILRPNDSIWINITKDTGGVLAYRTLIGYIEI